MDDSVSQDDPTMDGEDVARRSPRRTRRDQQVGLLHRDGDLIVLNKPAGVRTGDGPADEPSVSAWLMASGIMAQGRAVHRVYPLETEASGVLVLVSRAWSRDRLCEQMASGTLELCCLALVRGSARQEAGAIDRPIRAPRHAVGRARIDDRQGQRAVTEWRVRDAYVGFTLLECRPRTTVPHALRAHLASIGMPLAVDPIYGGADRLMLSSFKAGYRPSRRRRERPLIKRLTLHALSVRLTHPVTGEPIRLEAELPRDMRAALHQLDRFGRMPR